MFSPQTRINIKRILPFGLIWLMFALIYSLVEKGLLGNLNKYHTPKEEERIFMLLDMKSSTTIAEDIGHVRYFEMLSCT